MKLLSPTICAPNADFLEYLIIKSERAADFGMPNRQISSSCKSFTYYS